MKKSKVRSEVGLCLRFCAYGVISFALLALVLESPHLPAGEVSYKLIFTLAFVGGGSAIVSCLSGRMLYVFYKDLICGAD